MTPERYTLHGRTFVVLARFPDTDQGTTDANAYMTAHEGAAVLAVEGGHIILAGKADKGVPKAPPGPSPSCIHGRGFKCKACWPVSYA